MFYILYENTNTQTSKITSPPIFKNRGLDLSKGGFELMSITVHKTPTSILKTIVGLMTIFGVIGFTASVTNLIYNSWIVFEFVWLCMGLMVIGMIMTGILRK